MTVASRMPGLMVPAAGLPASGRGGAALRVVRLQQTQRVAGNRAAQRLVQRMDGIAIDRTPDAGAPCVPQRLWIQRDAANSAGASDHIAGDAAADEAQVSHEASTQAATLDTQGKAAAAPLQTQATAQGAALEGEGAAKGAALGQQSAQQASALQGQASAQAAQLNGQSAAQGSALQQEAGGASARLQGDVGTLESSARAVEASTEGSLATEAKGMQGEAEASAEAVQGQWGTFEAQTTGRLTSMTARTQALADRKAALVREYEGAGPHDPERFQKRWADLQAQIAPLEQEQSHLDRVEPSGESIGERAGAVWNALTNRSQALLNRVKGVASTAWNALQSRWSSVQSAAAAALAGLQGKASAAVNRLKALANSAWTGLQGVATQAWSGLQGVAVGVWTGLQLGATAAWTALQGAATTAWTALQGVANSVVGGLANKISGIVGRISGAINRIVDAITGALGSVLSRLRSATSSALDFLRQRATAAWTSVKSLGSRAWEGLKSIGTRVWQGAKDLGTRAWEGLKNLGTRAWQGLKDLGTRAWNGLKDLGQRAWNGLKSGWDWLKKKAQSAWNWLKGAWESVKRKATQAWDWVKRKAKDALAWLKKKWAQLKALVRKGWDWLKAKWKWLKGLVKITIRIRDQTLCKLHKFKPWKFVDLQSPRIPIVKTVVDPGIGPIELALFVQPRAEATVGGTVGPCTLKNIAFTLQPLISRYTGQADFHVGATANETLKLTGTIGGTANYGGLIALAGGGLEGRGTATALASFGAKPRFVYDAGKISATVPLRLEFCLIPKIDLDAFVIAQLIAGAAPSVPAPSPTPLLPPGPSPLMGPPPLLPAPGAGPLPALPRSGAGSTPAKAPPEKVLKEWRKAWHLGSWSRRECWDTTATFTLVAGPGGMPEADVEFSAKPVSLAEVIRSLFEHSTPGGGGSSGGGGASGGWGPLGQTYACAICKCSGDKECGGGRIHTIWMGKTECNRENKKKAQQLCNHDSTFLSICDLNQKRKDGKKCSVHHHDFACSERETEDKCANRAQSTSEGGPVGPSPGGQGECREKTGEPCPQALTVTWPGELPLPDTDRRSIIRSKKNTDEAIAEDRGPEQRKLRKAIDEAKARGLPPPQPCSTNRDNDPNGLYDAHHIHPIYLGGKDELANLCAIELDLHRRGHPKLNNQVQHIDEYEQCSYCTTLLNKHPAGQEYTPEE